MGNPLGFKKSFSGKIRVMEAYFFFFYKVHSSQVQKIVYWMNSSGTTDWCETESCTATSLQALATSSLPIKKAHYTSNLVVHSTLAKATPAFAVTTSTSASEPNMYQSCIPPWQTRLSI